MPSLLTFLTVKQNTTPSDMGSNEAPVDHSISLASADINLDVMILGIGLALFSGMICMQ